MTEYYALSINDERAVYIQSVIYENFNEFHAKSITYLIWQDLCRLCDIGESYNPFDIITQTFITDILDTDEEWIAHLLYVYYEYLSLQESDMVYLKMKWNFQ